MKRHAARICPKTGKVIRTEHQRSWPALLLPITGLLALVWFLLRVIPKPSRAAYPCQRMAMPLASGFVVWITGLVGSTILYRRARHLLNQSRYTLAAVCTVAAVADHLGLHRRDRGQPGDSRLLAERAGEQPDGNGQGNSSRPRHVGPRREGRQLGRLDRQLVGRRQHRPEGRRCHDVRDDPGTHGRIERCAGLERSVPALQQDAGLRRRGLPETREDRDQAQYEPGSPAGLEAGRRACPARRSSTRSCTSSSRRRACPARPSRSTTPRGTSAIPSTTRSGAIPIPSSRASRSSCRPRTPRQRSHRGRPRHRQPAQDQGRHRVPAYVS